MKLTRAIFALFIFCLTGVFAFSQEKAEKSGKVPFDVKVNVMILDAANKYVDDLKQDDLKIFEDNVEQKIAYFAKKEPVLNLGIVADNTGSMRRHLGGIIGIGQLLALNLREKDEAFIVRFINTEKISLWQEWTSNKSLLNKSLSSMYIEGGQSAIVDAMYLSVEQILKRAGEDKSKRYALVLISDCEERASTHNITQLFEKLKGTDVQVFVVAITQDLYSGGGFISKDSAKEKAETFVGEIALRTGGAAYFPILKENIKANDLAEMFKPLIYELRSQYIVGYTPANQNRNNKSRKLRIEVADAPTGVKRQSFSRESFIVPKN